MQIDTDFLVIGSGVSGLYLALHLADHGSVVLVTKGDLREASTTYAQGGIASVLADADSFESHIADTMNAGAGICDPGAVEILVREGPAHIRKLMQLGAHFERDALGNLDLAREGGHSANRIVHAADLTGKEIEMVLENNVRSRPVQILEQHAVVELLTARHSPDDPGAGVYGAYVYDRRTWDIHIIRAQATILATGGAGQVYLHNTNPEVSTGDGVALAYRAGALVANMEFFQFHPTGLYSERGGQTFLISEALRGAGARLLTYNEEPFMHRYDARLELAPRDIVARAIDSELKKSGSPHVWLDIRHLDRMTILEKFPNIFATCLDRGIDISSDLIPVVPAAHYMCGGVKTDYEGRTNLPGLFAVGETACTGVHGGNRLASNSLLEGLVFAGRIAQFLRSAARTTMPRILPWQKDGLDNAEEWILVQANFLEIKQVMWNYVGIVRSELRLHRALRRIDLLLDEVQDFYKRTNIQNKILELRNLCLVARLIVMGAMGRRESRGLHFSTDYPENREPAPFFHCLSKADSEEAGAVRT